MDAIADFFMNGYVMAGMGIILVALIGVLLFMRNRRSDD
jgi:LPXTG-motif cell wall-anchored protein